MGAIDHGCAQHLGLQAALGVGHHAAHLDGARLRVDHVGAGRHLRFKRNVGQGRQPQREARARAQGVSVDLARIHQHPQPRRVGDGEQRRVAGAELVGAQLLPRVQVALDHHAAHACLQRQRLAHAGAAAIHARVRAGAGQLGARAGGVGLGLLQILARHDAQLEQLALARQRLAGQRRLGLRLGGVSLRGVKVGRGQLRQHRAGGHRLAHVGANGAHPPGKGGVDALRARLVPGQLGRHLGTDAGDLLGGGGVDQLELRMAGGVTQQGAVQDGRRGLGRRGGRFFAARGQQEQGRQRGGHGQTGKMLHDGSLAEEGANTAPAWLRSCQAPAALAASWRAARASSRVARRVRRASSKSVRSMPPR